MSEAPHTKAYLCDECWNKLPHFKVDNLKSKKMKKKITIDSPMSDWPMVWIALYTTSCIVLMTIIGVYLWIK
jgi:hypothetical protein|tara:strand:- start:431 stop:646 length:216 start_codon:yes stop_codon:yes gene_type:complete